MPFEAATALQVRVPLPVLIPRATVAVLVVTWLPLASSNVTRLRTERHRAGGVTW